MNEEFIVELMESLKLFEEYSYSRLTKSFTIKYGHQVRLLRLMEICEKHKQPYIINENRKEFHIKILQ